MLHPKVFFRHETDSDTEVKSGLSLSRKKYIDLGSNFKLTSDINKSSGRRGAAIETRLNSNSGDTSSLPKKSKKKKKSSPSLETSKSANNDKASNQKVNVEAKPNVPKKNNSRFRINEGMLKALKY
ncbi:hypothetical protein AYI69_g9540 [Smittium culicis]|uniref:Uncharacterized protein n=1 Tax=Smittium culicis TaxID=133412 RepID=A0A1R1XBX3_9FUNG|nr:hypothetical protein AYI69_g9540 [Smittium culicis]